MEKVLFSINDFIKQLPKVEKQLLDDEIITKRLKKNEILFDNTKTDNRAYYVVQGLLRKFTLIEAKEITLDFFFRDEIYFPKTLDYKAPTATFLQALEEYQDFTAIAKKTAEEKDLKGFRLCPIVFYEWKFLKSMPKLSLTPWASYRIDLLKQTETFSSIGKTYQTDVGNFAMGFNLGYTF